MSRPACPRCLRPAAVCYCHTLQPIQNNWPVLILQHPREVRHAIGTARIAQLSLHNCQLFCGDTAEANAKLCTLLQQATVLVYPGADSIPLADIAQDAICNLLFIDGTWRKTHRMLQESPLLASLPKVSFTPTHASRYRIRKTPNAAAVSTAEAIALVLATLEGSADKYQPMLRTMDWVIEQQIAAMGQSVFTQNYARD